jgi:hypothetical protein
MTWLQNTDRAHVLHDAHGIVAGVWRGSHEGEPIWWVGTWHDEERSRWRVFGFAKSLADAKREAAILARGK